MTGMKCRYIRVINPYTIMLNKIDVIDDYGVNVSLNAAISATSIDSGYSLNHVLSNIITGTYRSCGSSASSDELPRGRRGIDNRRENNLGDVNIVEVDLGETCCINQIKISIPVALDSWKMFYCKIELIDERRKIWAKSEPLFHHHGRGEISVNKNTLFEFNTYPTEEMFAAGKLMPHTFDIKVDRYPIWNTIRRGDAVFVEPKLNIDYSELISRGSNFTKLGYVGDGFGSAYASLGDLRSPKPPA